MQGFDSDDRALLQRYADDQDHEAVQTLIGRYHDMVYGVCLRTLGNHHAADDAAQDSFLKLLRYSNRLCRRDSLQLGGWLYRVAASTASNKRRDEQVRRRYERRSADHKMLRPDDDDDAELLPLIEHHLQELPKSQQDVLVAYHLQGRTQAEIANDLGISQPAVKKRLDKAMGELRRRLRQCGALVGLGLLQGLFQQAAAATAPQLSRQQLLTSCCSTTLAPLPVLVPMVPVLLAASLCMGVGSWWAWDAMDATPKAPENSVTLLAPATPVEQVAKTEPTAALDKPVLVERFRTLRLWQPFIMHLTDSGPIPQDLCLESFNRITRVNAKGLILPATKAKQAIGLGRPFYLDGKQYRLQLDYRIASLATYGRLHIAGLQLGPEHGLLPQSSQRIDMKIMHLEKDNWQADVRIGDGPWQRSTYTSQAHHLQLLASGMHIQLHKLQVWDQTTFY